MTHSTCRRAFVTLVLFCSVALLPRAARGVSSTVVISQIYGGGGNSGATLQNDFIELYNLGSTPITVTGWSVQYASAAGTTWQVTPLTGIIQPGRYYLVQQAAGTGGTVNLPTPDATGSIAMSATAGKVALVNSAAALTGGCPIPTSQVVDFVGYGTANCFEGTAATVALAVASGADVVRVHDVATIARTLLVADAVVRR